MAKKSIIYFVIALVVISMTTYFAWTRWAREAPTPPPPPEEVYIPRDEGVWIPSEGVVFPKGGEKLEIGKTYEIQWGAFSDIVGPVSISLLVRTPEGRGYVKPIAEDIPADTSTYKWTVTSERPDNKYKIEIYPIGARELVIRSKEFSIIGDLLIIVDRPQPYERVTSPFKVTGKARRIFSDEGEFPVRLVGFVPGPKPMFIDERVRARAQDCDWLVGDWCNFEAELSFPPSPLEELERWWLVVEFYQRDEQFGERLIYNLPVVERK